MKVYLIVLSFLSILSVNVFAQDALSTTLDQNYTHYELITLNTDQLYDKLSQKNKFHDLSMVINDKTYELELWDSQLIKDDYKVTLASGKKHKGQIPIALKGHIKGDLQSKVRLTINSGFVLGFIEIEGNKLNIQPASSHLKSADPNLMIAYNENDVIDTEHRTCGVHNSDNHNLNNKVKNSVNQASQRSVGLCYEVDISLAADFAMFDAFGGETNTENQIVGILNDVEGDYDDEFADEILFDLSDVWISDCSTCDPWTSSNDSDELLDDFRDWAPSNLGSHDVASLWTDRNFSGTTIGLAWVGGACTSFRYNVLENFSGNTSLLRVVQSHELGHNFDATHDNGSGFIMSPSVNNTTSWSTDSEDDILDFFESASCFTLCGPSGSPPDADFDYDIISECTTGEVEFFDDSDGATSWLWTFEGGDPSTSTDQNPIVLYPNAGEFDVTLEVSNNFGSDTKEEEDEIEITDPPFADFDYDTDGLEVTFENDSDGGPDLDYLWEFGDGVNSNDFEPEHVYAMPGTYTVTLEIENDCGVDIIEEIIEVYDEPNASFISDNTTGCSGDDFQFTDLSYGNIEQWDWEFIGGSPSTSFDQNPLVIYNSPGVFDVTLEVENPEGESSLTQFSQITITPEPTSSFTFNIANSSVAFMNTSQNATDYSWSFGDGNTSNSTAPFHTYTTAGTFTVTLTAENECGSSSESQTVSINLEPVAQFSTVQATSGCASYTIEFEDNSLGNPTSWNWTFPGGNPANSTEQNPTVTYSTQGNYDVTLSVSNTNGSDVTTMSNLVMIDDTPQLNAAVTNNELVASFTSNYSNGNSILWNFGDGNTSTEDNPTHTYATSGMYNVSVSVSNNCGTTTENLIANATSLPVAGINANLTSGCAALSVSYLDASSPNTTAWNWTFPGGTPATSTLRNPVVSYESKGTYDVTLQVSNAFGSDVTTITSYITVDDVPTLTSNFTSNQLEANFSSTTTNATSILWNFGDGSTSAEANPLHIYNSTGTYNATVSASNNCGTVSNNLTVVISERPTAGITANTQSGCGPLTVNFSDASSANATAWNWSFPGGTPATSTEQNPTVTYSNPGAYDVSLTVSNTEGTDNQALTDYITVLSGPTVSYDFNQVGNRLELFNTTPGTTAQWRISDGTTLTNSNATHILATNGTYEVTLEVTNSCGSDVTEFIVVVDAYPTSSFTRVANSTSDCAPQTVEFRSNSLQATNFQWQFPGGTPATSNETNPTIIYNTAGIYDVVLEVSNQYGSDIIMQNAIVNVIDAPTIDFSTNTNGSTISFTNNVLNGVSYAWDFGDGNTSTLANPNHSYTLPGSYEVTLESTNDCGSSQLTRIVIVDFSFPLVNAQFSVNAGCAPLEVEITDQTTNNPTAWTWSFPGGSPEMSTDQNPVVTYTQAGTYTITAEVANADGTSTLEFTDVIVVNDVPTSDFELAANGNTVSFTNNSIGATSFSWDFGDGNISNEPEPENIYTETGVYEVILSATNECGTVESTQTVSIELSSTADIAEFGEWTISPNPSTGISYINFTDVLKENINFQLRNMEGKNIEEGTINAGVQRHRLSISDSGIYLLILTKDNKRDTKKISVVR